MKNVITTPTIIETKSNNAIAPAETPIPYHSPRLRPTRLPQKHPLAKAKPNSIHDIQPGSAMG